MPPILQCAAAMYCQVVPSQRILSPLGKCSSIAPSFERVRRIFPGISKCSASHGSLSASPIRPGLSRSLCTGIASSRGSRTILISGSYPVVPGSRLGYELGDGVVGQSALRPILSDFLDQRSARYRVEDRVDFTLVDVAPPGGD